MRTDNKFGVLRLCAHRKSGGGFTYLWNPPKDALRKGAFHHVTLGSDLALAKAKARALNNALENWDGRKTPKTPLISAKPNSIAHLFRRFEASPKFANYSARWRQDSQWIFRGLETHVLDNNKMFGDMIVSRMTRQRAYSLYESCIAKHGVESANKMMTACRAAFEYARLRFTAVADNPFTRLGRITPPSRRQRWAPEQLDAFVKMANWLGYPSVGCCALLCMELMQRPGDMLSLKWGAYDPQRKAWFIRQTKRGAEVFVPPTTRLERALEPIRRQAIADAGGSEISGLLVCATRAGRRWDRRGFTGAARMIARAAGIPNDLQIRDLRRTAATESASAGATPAEMMAVGGWQNQASIRPYLVQTAEQAMSCQAKREAYRRR